MQKTEIKTDVFMLTFFAVLILVMRPMGADVTELYHLLIIYFLAGIKREVMKLD